MITALLVAALACSGDGSPIRHRIETPSGEVSVDVVTPAGGGRHPMVMVVGARADDQDDDEVDDEVDAADVTAAAVARALRDAGIVAATPRWRTADDVLGALAWVREHAADLGADGSRFGLHAVGDGAQPALDAAMERMTWIRTLSLEDGFGVVIEGLRGDLPLLLACSARAPGHVRRGMRELGQQAHLQDASVRERDGEAPPAELARWHAAHLGAISAATPECLDPIEAVEHAEVLAARGRDADALALLERAVDLGFDAAALPARRALGRLRTDPRLRALVGERARSRDVRLVGDAEPGLHLWIAGQVVRRDGEPVAAARVDLHQTDATGVYSRTGGGDERARLWGVAWTDAKGRFTVRTVVPGGYPGTMIPAHVHVRVHDPAGGAQGLEILFADDPRLTPGFAARMERRGWVVLEPVLEPVLEESPDEDGDPAVDAGSPADRGDAPRLSGAARIVLRD